MALPPSAPALFMLPWARQSKISSTYAWKANRLNVKRAKWESNYKNDLHQTQIPRMFRGTFAQMRDRVQETVDFPDTIGAFVSATDSLSRRKVAETFAVAEAPERRHQRILFSSMHC